MDRSLHSSQHAALEVWTRVLPRVISERGALFARPSVLAADGSLGACQVQQPRVAADGRVEATWVYRHSSLITYYSIPP